MLLGKSKKIISGITSTLQAPAITLDTSDNKKYSALIFKNLAYNRQNLTHVVLPEPLKDHK